jgi:hypothetical protein
MTEINVQIRDNIMIKINVQMRDNIMTKIKCSNQRQYNDLNKMFNRDNIMTKINVHMRDNIITKINVQMRDNTFYFSHYIVSVEHFILVIILSLI